MVGGGYFEPGEQGQSCLLEMLWPRYFVSFLHWGETALVDWLRLVSYCGKLADAPNDGSATFPSLL